MNMNVSVGAMDSGIFSASCITEQIIGGIGIQGPSTKDKSDRIVRKKLSFPSEKAEKEDYLSPEEIATRKKLNIPTDRIKKKGNLSLEEVSVRDEKVCDLDSKVVFQKKNLNLDPEAAVRMKPDFPSDIMEKDDNFGSKGILARKNLNLDPEDFIGNEPHLSLDRTEKEDNLRSEKGIVKNKPNLLSVKDHLGTKEDAARKKFNSDPDEDMKDKSNFIPYREEKEDNLDSNGATVREKLNLDLEEHDTRKKLSSPSDMNENNLGTEIIASISAKFANNYHIVNKNLFSRHLVGNTRRRSSLDMFSTDSSNSPDIVKSILQNEALRESKSDEKPPEIMSGNHDECLHTADNNSSDEYDSDDNPGIMSFYNETLMESTFSEPKELFLKDSMLLKIGSSGPADIHGNKMFTDKFRDDNRSVMSFYDETLVGSQSSDTKVSNYSSQDSTSNDKKSQSKSAVNRVSGSSGSKYLIYTPRYKAPTKEEITNTLSEFNIPEHRYQEPFVSNAKDASNRKAVGRVLKIQSKFAADLQPFISNVENLTGIEDWRRQQLKEFFNASQRSSEDAVEQDLEYEKSALASQREVIIVPCKLPPSAAEVKSWLEKNKQLSSQPEEILSENITKSEASIRKIAMPLSPGQDGDSDDEFSLSLGSPLTPKTVNEEPVHVTVNIAKVHSTPDEGTSAQTWPSPACTPIHESARKNNPWKNLFKRSRKELKLGSPSQGNVSPLPSISEVQETEEGIVVIEEKTVLSTSQGLDVEQTEASDDLGHPLKTTVQTIEVHPPAMKLPAKQNNMQALRCTRRADSSCQIEGSTPNNTYGFRMSFENLQEVKAVSEHQYLTTFILELHFQTRGELRPDPDYDPIRAIFYTVVNDVPDESPVPRSETGVIAVRNLTGEVKISSLRGGCDDCKMIFVDDETYLLQELVKCVRKWDPDILAGYEVEMLSWGYVFQRAYKLEMNLYPLISRIPSENSGNQRGSVKAAPVTFTEDVKLAGRIILDVWRLMRHEVALQSYTFENVVYHILHQRVPLHSFKQLTFWWEHKTHLYRWICVDYYLLRVKGIVMLLDQLDLIGRTSELARLFGIQFLEVLSRGSQFRVESMMLRLAKPLNYVPVSPSMQQRAKMRAPEYLPLIMEPMSKFYIDPVIVLDFQSLYPSIIIAYNYCFSTSLGRVEHLGQPNPFPFGCTHLKVPPAQLLKLENKINISPCGVAFVQKEVRKGVLPRMLQEILDTRLMVKQSMKEHKSDKTLQRVLHSRQLGLKLIANVTYGYTAANFSGRMPCIEVGDSVVSKARETLERAILLVESTPRWGAQVVYGDTDSMFVLVPGKSREQAFKIGAEIAEAVTLDNPKPVKLKLEKVYQPCILQTKKRYVGYMYESPDQEKPAYDAKGIETVRRDGCPAVAKILEKSLRLLFETRDVSLIKNYVCRQFSKILQGRLNFQDLIFAREYRGMSGYRPGACVPALELTRRWLQTDKRAEPRRSERVPYIIINGPPGLPLIRLVRSPRELLGDPSLRPNATYYITRVIIPPLDRCFCLLGADVSSWYAEMPRKMMMSLPVTAPSGTKKCTISQHFATMNCAVCSELTSSGICKACQRDPQKTAVVLASKVQLWERTYFNISKVCQSCCGRPDNIECVSLDCPVLFRRNQASRELNQVPFIRSLESQYLTF